MRSRILSRIGLVVLLLVAVALSCRGTVRDRMRQRMQRKAETRSQGQTDATPPGQPATGPGGADYSHKSVVSHSYGSGVNEYWIYEPAEPKPPTAPLVIFLHGWGGMEPAIYGAWIEHIAKRGNIVVFPVYQTEFRERPKEILPNAITALKAALKELNSGAHVKADLTRVAVVGHSAGGDLTGDLAAIAATNGLPQPKAAMLVEAARGKEMATGRNIPLIPVEDFSKIPASTLMLVVVGDADTIAGDTDAKDFFKTASAVPPEHKDFIIVHSDSHGTPALNATHFAPVANEKMPQSIDALDYYAYWKLFDALSDCAFYKKNCNAALGNTPAQKFMGKWSDGTPVKELTIVKNP